MTGLLNDYLTHQQRKKDRRTDMREPKPERGEEFQEELFVLYQDALIQYLDEDEVSVLKDYSGRGMHGDWTCAFVTKGRYRPSGAEIGAAVAQSACDLDMDDWQKYLPSRSDSMGLGSVYY